MNLIEDIYKGLENIRFSSREHSLLEAELPESQESHCKIGLLPPCNFITYKYRDLQYLPHLSEIKVREKRQVLNFEFRKYPMHYVR